MGGLKRVTITIITCGTKELLYKIQFGNCLIDSQVCSSINNSHCLKESYKLKRITRDVDYHRNTKSID